MPLTGPLIAAARPAPLKEYSQPADDNQSPPPPPFSPDTPQDAPPSPPFIVLPPQQAATMQGLSDAAIATNTPDANTVARDPLLGDTQPANPLPRGDTPGAVPIPNAVPGQESQPTPIPNAPRGYTPDYQPLKASPNASDVTLGREQQGFSSSVERWRPLVSQYFSGPDVNKMLYVISKESGGNPDAKNPDSGALGLVQGLGHPGVDFYNPDTSIKWAAQQVANHGWTDWGEGNSYKGKNFGALGTPSAYGPGGTGTNDDGSTNQDASGNGNLISSFRNLAGQVQQKNYQLKQGSDLAASLEPAQPWDNPDFVPAGSNVQPSDLATNTRDQNILLQIAQTRKNLQNQVAQGFISGDDAEQQYQQAIQIITGGVDAANEDAAANRTAEEQALQDPSAVLTPVQKLQASRAARGTTSSGYGKLALGTLATLGLGGLLLPGAPGVAGASAGLGGLAGAEAAGGGGAALGGSGGLQWLTGLAASQGVKKIPGYDSLPDWAQNAISTAAFFAPGPGNVTAKVLGTVGTLVGEHFGGELQDATGLKNLNVGPISIGGREVGGLLGGGAGFGLGEAIPPEGVVFAAGKGNEPLGSVLARAKSMSRAELQAIAEREGVESAGSKADIVAALQEKRAGQLGLEARAENGTLKYVPAGETPAPIPEESLAAAGGARVAEAGPASSYTPEQIDSLRQSILDNIRSHREGTATPEVLSPDEIALQRREGIYRGPVPNVDYADQLQQSIDAVRAAQRQGSLTPAQAEAASTAVKKKAFEQAGIPFPTAPVEDKTGSEWPDLLRAVQREREVALNEHGTIGQQERDLRAAAEARAYGSPPGKPEVPFPTDTEPAQGQMWPDVQEAARQEVIAANREGRAAREADWQQKIAAMPEPNATPVRTPMSPEDAAALQAQRRADLTPTGPSPTPIENIAHNAKVMEAARSGDTQALSSAMDESPATAYRGGSGEAPPNPPGPPNGQPKQPSLPGGFEDMKSAPLESPAHRAYREAVSVLMSPLRFLTYAHLGVFRQGIGFAADPRQWPIAREAFVNLWQALKNPESRQLIEEGLNRQDFVKAAMSAGWLKPHSESELPETWVNKLIDKVPFMTRVEGANRAYFDTLRKSGYNAAAEALSKTGENDSDAYKALWETISDVTGHGSRGRDSLQAGGIPLQFSPQAWLGRVHSLTDVFTKPGSWNPLAPGAKSVAIRNLVTIGAITGIIEGTAKAAGWAGLPTDVKLNTHTPLGKVTLGEEDLDPTAGLQSIVRLGVGLAGAAHMMSEDPTKGLQRAKAIAASYMRGQFGPTADTIISTWTGQDWQGKQFNLIQRAESGRLLKDLYEPIAARSIEEGFKANGLMGALFAAPSLGAMEDQTNLLADARDKSAQKIGQIAKNPDGSPRYPTKDGNPAKTFDDLTSLGRYAVNQTPDVKAAAGGPNAYQRAAETSHQHALDVSHVTQEEDLYSRGLNDKKLLDVYHDRSVAMQMSAADLADRFQSQFQNFDKTKFDKALEGYFNIDIPSPKYDANGAEVPGGVKTDADATGAARQDYLAKLPTDQQAWVKDALQLSEEKKTPLQREVDQHIADKKTAGYFDIKPDDPDAAKKRLALDVANPKLDYESWKYNSVAGKAGASLNSGAAVDLALADPASKHIQIKLKGIERPINETPQTVAAWQYARKPLLDYLGPLVDRNAKAEAARLYDYNGNAEYLKPYDQMSPGARGAISGNIRERERYNNPKLDAFLVWNGDGKLHSHAAEAELGKIFAQYGKTAPKPGFKVEFIENPE